MKPSINALLVEDNPSDAHLFHTIISASEDIRPNIHHTERFKEALLILENQAFDIVLLDLCLPDGNGIPLIKQLRELSPQVPIIVLTGLQDQKLALQALHEGVQDYLIKSDTFSPSRLAKLGYTDVGNLLAKTLQYAIERSDLACQLELSQERYALAVQGSNDGIWDWNLKTDLIYYSPRWLSQIGTQGQQVCAHPDEWLSRIHPEDKALFDHQLQQHLTCQQHQFCCEYRILHTSGSYRWMLTRGMALWDEQGVAYRIAGSQTDITNRKSLEQQLHTEKELAQITLHSIGDAVITTDEKGCIKAFNPVAERLTGWKAKRRYSKACVASLQYYR